MGGTEGTLSAGAGGVDRISLGMPGSRNVAGETDCEVRKPPQPAVPSSSIGRIANHDRFQLKRIAAVYGACFQIRNA